MWVQPTERPRGVLLFLDAEHYLHDLGAAEIVAQLQRDTVLRAMSLSDVQWFFQRWYAPDNATLALVGNFDVPQAKRWIEHYFGPLKRSAPEPKRRRGGAVTLAAGRQLTVKFPGRYAKHVWAWPTPPVYAEGDAELDVLLDVLEEQVRNALEAERNADKRERPERFQGWFSASVTSRVETSEAKLRLTVSDYGHLDRAIEIVEAHLAKLRAGSIPQRMIREYETRWNQAALDSNGLLSRATDYANFHRIPGGREATPEANARRYSGMTAAGLGAVARRWLPPKAVVRVRTSKGDRAPRTGRLRRDRRVPLEAGR